MNYIPNAISVVIPTYNRAHLIKASIQSVLDQTLQPYEIIIVDDFSTDNTEEVINSMNSPLIKFVKNQRKKGANGARNTGILLAQGEYIAFHDSDDFWLEEKLELQMNCLQENKNIDFCFCSLKKEGGGIFSRSVVPHKQLEVNDIPNLLKLHNWISTQTILVKNSKAREFLFDEDLNRFQDWDFVLRYSQKYKIIHLNKDLIIQKLNNSSITNTINYLESYKKIYIKYPDLVEFGINNKIINKKIILMNNWKFSLALNILLLSFVLKLKNIFL